MRMRAPDIFRVLGSHAAAPAAGAAAVAWRPPARPKAASATPLMLARRHHGILSRSIREAFKGKIPSNKRDNPAMEDAEARSRLSATIDDIVASSKGSKMIYRAEGQFNIANGKFWDCSSDSEGCCLGTGKNNGKVRCQNLGAHRREPWGISWNRSWKKFVLHYLLQIPSKVGAVQILNSSRFKIQKHQWLGLQLDPDLSQAPTRAGPDVTLA
ncbi:hypothetical protein SETIT_3G082000v2 [Setaria italica]|uniref:Uncharacterized protein n=1 Tax=Setaria italica TaxID=4555 RepID=A0A368QCS1_SETIT|nr:hypothetical protein SETIT_3G082000v2 [Setaria italica]